MLPNELTVEIDQQVGREQRAEFVARVVAEQLARLRRLAIVERAAGPLADKDIPGWQTRESTVEWVRAQRHLGTDPWSASERPPARHFSLD